MSAGVLITIFTDTFNLDFRISQYFFSAADETGAHWAIGKAQPWRWLYDFGEIPPFILPVICLFLLVYSYLRKEFRKYRKASIVVLLTVILGPGLIVNAGFKENWGRARPSDCIQFNGSQQFCSVSQPSGPGKGKSFPCGHCAMAISGISIGAFYVYRSRLALVGIILSVIYSLMVSFARIAQGGHFLTDVVWSLIIVPIIFMIILYVCAPSEE